MREHRFQLNIDRYEKSILINSLNNLRTRQIEENRPTEPVDELIEKVASAPLKKFRIKEMSHEER